MRVAGTAPVDPRNAVTVFIGEHRFGPPRAPVAQAHPTARDKRKAPALVEPCFLEGFAIRHAVNARLPRGVNRDEDELDEKQRSKGEVKREEEAAAAPVGVNTEAEEGFEFLLGRVRLRGWDRSAGTLLDVDTAARRTIAGREVRPVRFRFPDGAVAFVWPRG